MWRVPLFDLDYDSREAEALQRVLASRWLATGAENAAFEAEFAAFMGGDVHCVTLANGTAALHLALLLHGIGPGDEVVVPALTFVADLNVVRLCGATPVLADCAALDDWNVAAETIAPCLNERTKAVLVVHYAGVPCAMEPILELCAARGVPVIEDCAHAPGSRSGGQHCGSFGSCGCFSFFSNKNLAMGEGGLLVSTDPELAAQARLLRSHGLSSMTVERHAGKEISYDVLRPGLNYRLDELHAALGRVQLAKLAENNRRRQFLDSRYRTLLQGVPGLDLPFGSLPQGVESSCHIFPVLLAEPALRAPFMGRLKEQGIQTSIHYPAMDGFSCYRGWLRTPPLAADIAARTVTLPLYPGLQEAQQDHVVHCCLDFFAAERRRT